ncbi:MAG: GntR family transcriptional regulator [Geminicoccaceae bacterium]
MNAADLEEFFAPEKWHEASRGPRYAQLSRHIASAIRDGRISGDIQLPPERDLARFADVSRVTVRKAIAELVAKQLVEQRQGSGSYIRPAPPVELAPKPSSFTSFTEYMRLRGYVPRTVSIASGVFLPRSEEVAILGLSPGQQVARMERLRFADDLPVAIEQSTVPADILPDPNVPDEKLHEHLGANGYPPARAVRRIDAVALSPRNAELLQVEAGSPALKVDHTGFLAAGRPVEFTRGFYLSGYNEFVIELAH